VWPYPPNKPKVTYVMDIKGFKPSGDSQSLFETIAYGRSGSDDDSLGLPVALATGRDGRLAVADMGRRCVHFYVPSEQKYVRLSDGGGEALTSPVGVIFDDELRLYVSDSVAGKIFVFGGDGKFLSTIDKTGSGQLKRPTGLAYNLHKKLLYVVDTFDHKIYAFNTKGEVLFSFGGRGEKEGMFNFPTYIFWSPAGNIYVADTMNFRVEIFDDMGRFLDSFGRHGDGTGNLAMPKGVAADKDGVIYVVDSFFDNVQLFDRKGTFLLTVGKRGGDKGEFWLPSGVFIDDGGILYISDSYNKRVQVFKITENYAGGKQ
jgi:DNA-binding beta-propeller fold protein YncE